MLDSLNILKSPWFGPLFHGICGRISGRNRIWVAVHMLVFLGIVAQSTLLDPAASHLLRGFVVLENDLYLDLTLFDSTEGSLALAVFRHH